MAHFIQNDRPTSLVEPRAGARAEIQLWGAGANGEALDVVSSDPGVFTVAEIPASFGPDLRSFSVRGLRRGSARIYARLGPGGPPWADARVIVGYDVLERYYHGTSSAIADLLMSVDLTPMILASLARGSVTAFDWSDYTDFGQGFYVHLEVNRRMAHEWAMRRFGADWAVVEFVAAPDELDDLRTSALHFRDKAQRPSNTPRPVRVVTTVRELTVCPLPQVLPCISVAEERTTQGPAGRPMSWLEFVEHNRHIDPRGALIARPNDRDWTSQYSSIRGPIWVPRDSGYDVGLPPFPAHVHQLNWGRSGMAVLNRAEVKVRRFKFGAHNEGLFPSPLRSGVGAGQLVAP